MKKRIVAVLLSLTMVMATGAEAWAADLADFSAEAVVTEVAPETDTEQETAVTEGEVTAADDVADSAETVPAEEEDITSDEQQDTEEPSGDNTADDADDETEADFSSEEISVLSDEDPVQPVEEEQDEAGIAGATVVYTDWEFVSNVQKWRLLKNTASTHEAAETGAVQVGEDISADTSEGEVTATEETLTAEEASTETGGMAETAEEGQDEVGASYYTGWVKVKSTDVSGKEISSGTYHFNTEGYLDTGYVKVDNIGYYLMPESSAKSINTVESGRKSPYNSTLGRLQSGWVWLNNAFHYFGSDGKESAIKEGFQDINGNRYYLQSNGVPVVGQKVISGNTYMFRAASGSGDIPGKMVKDAWYGHSVGGRTQWRYYQSNGAWKKYGTGIYKLYSNSNNYYLLDSNGYLITSTKMTKGADGGVYLANKSGVAYRDALVKKGKFRYYFQSNGKRASYKNCWARLSGAGNRYYYFGKTYGRVVEKKGFQKVTVNKKFIGWFYFQSNGDHLQNAWSGDRYFLADGRMASGVTKVGGSYFFFQRSSTKAYKGKRYKATWIKYKGKYYYAKRNGKLAYTGWQKLKINKKSYWFYFQNATAKTNTKITRAGISGYLDSRGRFTTGWVIVSSSGNKVRYIDPSTGKYAKNKVLWIEGKQYRFDKKGYRVNDRTSEFKQSSYYLECDRINGLITVYTNRSKQIPIKTIRVSVGNPETPTRTGTFTLTRAGRWQELMGPSWGQYGTHVTGGIFIHSVACGAANSYNLPAGEYNKLGRPASHGCIRCCVADAKWVWNNCNGSTIYVFDGEYESEEAFKGPLGRKPLTPLRGSKNFDPTDPAVK